MSSTDDHLEAMQKSSNEMSANSKRLADSIERLEKRLGLTLDQFDHFLNQIRVKEAPDTVDDLSDFKKDIVKDPPK